MPSLTARRVITPEGIVGPARVHHADGLITAVEPERGSATIDAAILAPGFVDLQVNGYDDVDVGEAGPDEWARIGADLLAGGVTAWCPTLPTRRWDTYPAAIATIVAARADGRSDRPAILGAHLEGPFLGGAPGAHRPADFVEPTSDRIDALATGARLVTLAPEAPDATRAVVDLAGRGIVVSLGHTAAALEEMTRATDAGARLVTHVFNGMPPMHHRAPGPVGAALSDDRLAVSIIADLVHVAPAAIRIVFAAKGRGRVVLVSDAVAWSRFGLTVDGAARRADGTLAGSVIRLSDAVRNCVNACGIDLFDAVTAASTTPADLVGERGHGRIAPGARADLVAIDDDLAVTGVWLAGEAVR